jgi:uncharacterized protein (AIM24 family)
MRAWRLIGHEDALEWRPVLRVGAKKYLGGESLFINEFTNNTSGPRRITLVQSTRATSARFNSRETHVFSAGAYLASTPGIKLG